MLQPEVCAVPGNFDIPVFYNTKMFKGRLTLHVIYELNILRDSLTCYIAVCLTVYSFINHVSGTLKVNKLCDIIVALSYINVIIFVPLFICHFAIFL